MAEYQLFTSESVSEGHPDKMADQISDAILDEMLRISPDAQVAVETLVKTGMVVLAEIRLPRGARWTMRGIVRRTVAEIGLHLQRDGLRRETCAVINAIGAQSADIAMGVDEAADREQGPGTRG